jgi:hypothetical protein
MSRATIPILYASWVDQLIGKSLLVESRSTCLDCAQCASDSKPPSEFRTPPFLPDIKCCTYQPELPNFLVGRILLDASPEAAEGRTRVSELVRSHRCATPLGLSPSPGFWKRYQAEAPSHFGRAPHLTCSFLNDGMCSIWRHRNSACSTYFCLHERGVSGARLWKKVRAFLQELEVAVQRWCFLELDPTDTSKELLFQPDGTLRRFSDGEIRGPIAPNGEISEAMGRLLWGQWFAREEQYYRECAEAASTLTDEQLLVIGGSRLRWAIDDLKASIATTYSRVVPERLGLGRLRTEFFIKQKPDGAFLLHHQEARQDPLVLNAVTLDALVEVFERPASVRDAIARLRSEKSIELTMRDIRKFLDYRLLVVEAEAARTHDPLKPDSWLAIVDVAPSSFVTGSNDGVETTALLTCGTKKIAFESSEHIHFARRVYESRNGFQAHEAMTWGPTDSLPWETVKASLQRLLKEGVLEFL